MLRDEISPLNSESIIRKLTSPSRICGLSIVPTIGSTNTWLKERQKEDQLPLTSTAPYFCLLSEEQTAGRGRLGRSFYSPSGCGIYLSLAIKVSELPIDVMEITTIAAVAVSMAIEKATKKAPKIKWVNDIFIDNKKICGILAEGVSKVSTGGLETVILGIGVNYYLVKEEVPEELTSIVGALYDINTPPEAYADRNHITAEIINHLLFFFEDDVLKKSYLEEYRKRSLVLGHEITIIQGESRRRAQAIDIDSKGGLIVHEADGSQTTLSTGEVSIRL